MTDSIRWSCVWTWGTSFTPRPLRRLCSMRRTLLACVYEKRRFAKAFFLPIRMAVGLGVVPAPAIPAWVTCGTASTSNSGGQKYRSFRLTRMMTCRFVTLFCWSHASADSSWLITLSYTRALYHLNQWICSVLCLLFWKQQGGCLGRCAEKVENKRVRGNSDHA